MLSLDVGSGFETMYSPHMPSVGIGTSAVDDGAVLDDPRDVGTLKASRHGT